MVAKKLVLLFSFISLQCFIFNSKDKKALAYLDSPRPPIERAAISISKNLSNKNKEKRYKVIVLTFTDVNGKSHEYGEVLAEKLSTELAKRENLLVYDRLIYKRKLEDNDLSLQGGTDLSSMKKIGELLGLDGLVIGLISPYMNGLDVNCRMIDAETGSILAADETYYPLGD